MSDKTVRDLSKLYYLNKLIERDTQRLEELEAQLQPGAVRLNGMPRNGSHLNRIEEIIPRIVELQDRIRERRIAYIVEREEIEIYLQSVDDYQVRLIMAYRFVDLLTWRQIAQRLGGNNTEDSVKKACYRYLKRKKD